MTDKAQSSIVAGWREWVSLPSAGVPWIKAKLDTGARSSSVHAYDVTITGEGSEERVRFRLQPWQESREDAVVVESPIRDRRHVRSSSGHVEERIVVIMRIALLGREIETEMTLSNRDEMGFRMLIGRQALRQGFLVDPAKSFLGGRAPREVRRRNRNR
ncbi:MAG: RimK/LysX family protein [Microcella sp.]|uniref:ATP-dependent zinc protease family protein n=1 Tax=Microcella sp. TaxID=1913979 RepID=UPI0033150D9F